MTEPKYSLKGNRKRRSIKFPFEDTYPIIKTIRKELGITDSNMRRMEDDLRTFGFLPEVDKNETSYGVIAPGFIPDANINGLIKATKQGLIKNDAFVNAYEDLAEFFNKSPYIDRLKDYFKNTLGLSDDYSSYRINDVIGEMQYNMMTAKPKIVKQRDLGENVGGRWNPNNTIEVVEDRLHSSVPKHELIHASDEGKSFLDNAKYKMRPKAEELFTLATEGLDKATSLEVKKLYKDIYDDALKDIKYFGDDVEQRPRVLNTLMDMKAKGFPINKLTQADVDEYFDVPVETLPSDTQSLLGNYVYEDILPALQNFKTVATPFVVGATGYGVKRRLESNGQKSK